MKEKDPGILIEQYKIMVDSLIRLSERRQSYNRFYMTIITALIVATWSVFTRGSWEANTQFLMAGILLFFTAVVALIWRKNINGFRILAHAKTEIIHSMEGLLPCQPFREEYFLAESETGNKPALSLWEEKLPAIVEITAWAILVLFAAMAVGL